MVAIRVYGASDDLVEVIGPCYEWDGKTQGYSRQCEQGEYGAWSAEDVPTAFRLVDAEREPLAIVYALYAQCGTWAFALGQLDEEHPLPGTIKATIEQSEHCEYSAELVIEAPDGTRFDMLPT